VYRKDVSSVNATREHALIAYQLAQKDVKVTQDIKEGSESTVRTDRADVEV
jgi:hypothetical protein